MKWRVLLEVTGTNGMTMMHEVSVGTRHECDASPATIGLALTEGKSVLAILPRCLVQAQAACLCEEHRRCRPLRRTMS